MNRSGKSGTNLVPVWVRYLVPLILMALLWLSANVGSKFREPPGFDWYALVWILAALTLLWWQAERISLWLDRKVPWEKARQQRVLFQTLLVTATGVVIFDLTFIILNWVENNWVGRFNPLGSIHLVSASLMGFLLVSLINALMIGFQLREHNRQAELKAERFRLESKLANLESLKQQIDPHFLFNNFSTLHGLIFEDQERAGDYLMKLSDVYRAVLNTVDQEQISLKRELELIQPYIELLKIRFGDRLRINQEQLTTLEAFNLPPLAIQSLIENAVKHNLIDHDHPLTILISGDGYMLTVSNNLQLKSSNTEGQGLGLKHLSMRVAHLTGKALEINTANGQFSVTIPLANG